MSENDELRAAYRVICRKCGSEDVVFNIEQFVDYGGDTGYSGGQVTLGCNGCKQNDLLFMA